MLSQDTAVELGNPRDVSTSFLLWDEGNGSDEGNAIFLNGPDLPQRRGSMLPFGKVVLIHGRGFTAENTYDRCRELEGVRYALDLKGYMLRAVSQYQREWSRISKEAMDNGFSLRILGGALIDKFLELDFVRSVEVIFITAGRHEVLEMKAVSDQVMKVIGAMNKMTSELSFDCQS